MASGANVRSALLPIAILLLSAIPTWGLCGPDGQGDGQDIMPTRAWLDIAFERVEVSKTYGNKTYPGGRVRFDIYLGHDDDPTHSDTPVVTNSTIVLTLHVYDNVTTLYGQVPSIPVDRSVNRSSPDYDPVRVFFIWNAPVVEPDAGWENTTIEYSAMIAITDDDMSDNFISGSFDLTPPDSCPFIEEMGQVPGTFRTAPPYIRVRVGKTFSFDFLIWNMGVDMDVIGMEVLSSPDGWKSTLSSPSEIWPGQFNTGSIELEVPDENQLALAETEYEILVRAYSVFDPIGPYPVNSTHTFVFTVDPVHTCEIDPEKESVYLTPGAASNVTFFLKNTGNAIDNYTFLPIIEPARGGGVWEVGMVTDVLHDIMPNETVPIVCIMTVPLGTARYMNKYLILNCTSEGSGQITESGSCLIFAGVYYDASLERFPEPIPVEPGEWNRLRFEYTNEGNDNDPNARVNVSSVPDGWIVVIDDSYLHGIRPVNNTWELFADIYVNELTPPTFFGPRPFIVLEAWGGPDERRFDEQRIEFEVSIRHRVSLSCNDPVRIGSNGTDVNYSVEIKNTGNRIDSFNVSGLYPWTDLESDIYEVSLSPGQSAIFDLRVSIPVGLLADADPDTPGPDERGMYDPYPITLTGISQNTSNLEDGLDSLILELYILPFTDHSIEAFGESYLILPLGYEQQRRMGFQVRNPGNIRMEAGLELRDAPWWMSLEASSVELGPNGTEVLDLVITYPGSEYDEEITYYPKIYSILDHNGSSVERSLVLTVEIRQYLLEIVSLGIEGYEPNGEDVYVIPHGRGIELRTVVRRTGPDMTLPEDFSGPIIALSFDGVQFTKGIPLMENGEEWTADLGPILTNFTGDRTLTVQIEGIRGDTSGLPLGRSVVVRVEGPPSGNDESVDIDWIVPLLIVSGLLLFMIGGIFFYLRSASGRLDHLTDE